MKTQQKIFMNRELSWLKFNERVLEEAENKEVPLCERLTFASIYQSNLDEFFMVRVGSLIDQILLDKNMKENKTKMTPKEQLDAIMPQVRKLNRRKDNVYEEMMDSLKEHNIHFVNFQKISKKESEYLRAYFQAEIAPLISPTIIGKRQPFPFLKNKEIYAVAVLETKNGKEKLGIIPCGNEVFERLINIPGKDAYMLSEEMILHYVPRIFKGYHVKAKTLIRIDNGYLYEDCGTIKQADAIERCARNECAFIVGIGTSYQAAVVAQNPDVKMAMIPICASQKGGARFCGIGEGASFGIWKDTDEMDVCKAFLNYVAENADGINAAAGEISTLPSETTKSYGMQMMEEMESHFPNVFYDNLWDRKYMPSGMWNVFQVAAGMFCEDQSDDSKQEIIDYLKENYTDLYEAAQES